MSKSVSSSANTRAAEPEWGVLASLVGHAPAPSASVSPGIWPCPGLPADTPPFSNTGVENTSADVRRSPVSFIDGISLTFHYDSCDSIGEDGMQSRLAEVWDIFGARDCWMPCSVPRGKANYACALVQDSVVVAWNNDRPEMGIHVTAMGKGCAAIANRPNFPGWQTFLRELLDWEGAKISRLDLAIDDAPGLFAKLPGIQAMDAHLRKGFGTMAAENWELRLPGKANKGMTLEIGSRVSDTFIRCYDKGHEQRSRGVKCDLDWVRVELELKRKRAQAAARLIADVGVSCIPGLLRYSLDFKEDSADSNMSRRGSVSWWAEFLDGAESIQLVIQQPIRSIPKLLTHLSSQYGPSIHALMCAARGEVDWIRHISVKGMERLRSKHTKMLKEFERGGQSFDFLVASAC